MWKLFIETIRVSDICYPYATPTKLSIAKPKNTSKGERQPSHKDKKKSNQTALTSLSPNTIKAIIEVFNRTRKEAISQ